MFVIAIEAAMQTKAQLINNRSRLLKFKSLSNLNFVTIKLKISFMAAREGISILELFVQSIIKTYWMHYVSEDLSLLRSFDEKELQEQQNLKMSPLMIINCIYNLNRGSADKSTNVVKKLARIKGLEAKLVYQRMKFQMFLKVHSKLKMNIVDKMPAELNSSRLPLSYQYYETVPILLSRCIEVVNKKQAANDFSTLRKQQAV